LGDTISYTQKLVLLNARVAVLEVENKNLREQMLSDKEDLKYLKSGLGRVLWMIGGGAITTIVGWFVARGLAGG
jgi:hypothetical protein